MSPKKSKEGPARPRWNGREESSKVWKQGGVGVGGPARGELAGAIVQMVTVNEPSADRVPGEIA